jgi:hypothetical protein
MMMVLVVLHRLASVNNALGLLTIAVPGAVVTYLFVWIVIPGGRETLVEIAYDLSASLHLDRRYTALMSSRGKGARVF